mmetsp:Transcript_6289/g.5404  ORF Transcript_6289/g.5404 Transcript_6289/m.5404 type:complete len:363 (+) Transcript_6289:26-1114(+)
MKKYYQPTVSSMHKVKDSTGGRNKLDRLTNAVKKLQNQAKNESMFKNTFERESVKISDEVKDQMEGIKSSFVNTFNSLSDIMIEEFESIRTDLQITSEPYCPMHRTIEHLTLLCSKYENDLSHLHKRQDLIESQLTKNTPKSSNSDLEMLKTQVNTNKENYKSLCDQVGDIISNINEEVNLVKTSTVSCNTSIDNLKRNITDLNQSMKLSKSMILTSSNKENMFKQTNLEMENVTKEIEELNIFKDSFKDNLKDFKGEIDILKENSDIKHSLLLLEENDENLNKNLMYLKEKIEKYISKPVSNELENNFYNVHSEHKIMQKKVNVIENMFISNRNELGEQMTELEKLFITKNENLNQAICHI